MATRIPRSRNLSTDAVPSPDVYFSLRALAAYASLSVRTLRGYLVRPHALPHYRVRGKILVKRSEFDKWIAEFRVLHPSPLDEIVTDVLRSL